jgi:hypothetical protein
VIYFLQSLDGGPVKIGTTDNLELRRKQLEARYGQSLALLATLPGGVDEEKVLHRRFAHIRFGATEQFIPTAELYEFIGHVPSDDVPPVTEAMATSLRTVGVRATAEWADWLERLAKHNRTDIAKVLDAAATHYAKATGFNEPPPERVP